MFEQDNTSITPDMHFGATTLAFPNGEIITGKALNYLLDAHTRAINQIRAFEGTTSYKCDVVAILTLAELAIGDPEHILFPSSLYVHQVADPHNPFNGNHGYWGIYIVQDDTGQYYVGANEKLYTGKDIDPLLNQITDELGGNCPVASIINQGLQQQAHFTLEPAAYDEFALVGPTLGVQPDPSSTILYRHGMPSHRFDLD